jgi:hypothetical protein
VVPKHRRSEIEPSLASLGAPLNTAEFWPEAVGFGQAAAGGVATAVHERVGPPANGPASNSYDGTAEQRWAASPEGLSWQDWQEWQQWRDWRDWGPLPDLHPDHPSAPVPRVQLPADHPSAPVPRVQLPADHPSAPVPRVQLPADHPSAPVPRVQLPADHPSAPVPRVQFPADHPSRPMPTPRAFGAPEQPQRRPGGSRAPRPQIPDVGYDNGNRRLRAMPDGDASGYQRQAGNGWQEAADYRRDSGPSGPGPGPAAGQFHNGPSPSRDMRRTGGQAATLADGQAVQFAQQVQSYAIAIRQAAERDAAAITQQATGQAAVIREAAEQQAAELQARLESMSGQLGWVAAYVTERLAPVMPATAPVMPATAPVMPATAPVMPATAPVMPGTRSVRPASRTASPASPARPAGPDTRPDTRPAGPAKPRTTPTKKQQKRPRQSQAMRIATATTAALLLFAVGTGVTEVALHGFQFFVFRSGGTGETRGDETDQQFLARQAAAAHHVAAPQGRHHKTPQLTPEVHHS